MHDIFLSNPCFGEQLFQISGLEMTFFILIIKEHEQRKISFAVTNTQTNNFKFQYYIFTLINVWHSVMCKVWFNTLPNTRPQNFYFDVFFIERKISYTSTLYILSYFRWVSSGILSSQNRAVWSFLHRQILRQMVKPRGTCVEYTSYASLSEETGCWGERK